PQMAVSRSSEQLFSTMVLRPWCAIEFGNVAWCLAHAPGDPLTRAERWLRFEPGTPERNAEYNVIYSNGSYKPDDPKLQRQLAGYKVDPTRDRANVDMQGKSKTLIRVGL